MEIGRKDTELKAIQPMEKMDTEGNERPAQLRATKVVDK